MRGLWNTLYFFFRRRRWLLTLAFFAGIGKYIFSMYSEIPEFNFIIVSPTVDAIGSGVFFYVLIEIIAGIHALFNRLYPFERSITGRIFIQLLVSGVIILGIRSMVVLFAIEQANLQFSQAFTILAFMLDLSGVFLVNAWLIAIHFLNSWKGAVVEQEQLKKASIRAQYEALKNQVNPHFLFNSFTTLNELIFEDPKDASHYLEQLSLVYRYILKNTDVNQVTVGKELDFLKSYIHLLEIRHGNNLQINIDLSAEMRRTRIPPMTFQILLENAVKHNIITKEKPLQVRIFAEDDMLWISNNFQPRPPREIRKKMGLQNIRDRYALLNEETVEVIEGPEQWVVKLPIHAANKV